MNISVIIVNWNVRDLLCQCLHSVVNSLCDSTLTYDIWVADNASSDGSVAMVQDLFPHVRMIANAENRGFAAANNQAIERAAGRRLLLLNPDTEVKGQAIATLFTA